jgi:hypothetical protein
LTITSGSMPTYSWISLGKVPPVGPSGTVTTCTSSEASGSGCSNYASTSSLRNWQKLVDDRYDKCMIYFGANPNSTGGTFSESLNCYDITDAIEDSSITGTDVINKLLWSWLSYTVPLSNSIIGGITCSGSSISVYMQLGSTATVWLPHTSTGDAIVNTGGSYVWISGTGGTFDSYPANGVYQVTGILTYANSNNAPTYASQGEYNQATAFTATGPSGFNCTVSVWPTGFIPPSINANSSKLTCSTSKNACLESPLDDSSDPVARHPYGGIAWDVNRSVMWLAFGTGNWADPDLTHSGSVNGDAAVTDFYKFDPNPGAAENTTNLPQWHLQCTSMGTPLTPGSSTAPPCGVGPDQEMAMDYDPIHDMLFGFGRDSGTNAYGRIYCIRDNDTPSGAGACPVVLGSPYTNSPVPSNTWVDLTSTSNANAPWATTGHDWDFPAVIFDPNASVNGYPGEFVIFGGNVYSGPPCPTGSLEAGFDYNTSASIYCQPASTYFYDPVNGYTVAATAAGPLGPSGLAPSSSVDNMPEGPRSPLCGYAASRSSIICVADGGDFSSASQVWEWKSAGTTLCGASVPAWCLLTGIVGTVPAINSGANNHPLVSNIAGFDNDTNAFVLFVNNSTSLTVSALEF